MTTSTSTLPAGWRTERLAVEGTVESEAAMIAQLQVQVDAERLADFNARYNMSGKNLKAKYRGGSR